MRLFFYNLTKRLIDIVLVLISLPFVLPVCLVIAILIKWESPGPAFFWSTRIGQHRRPFPMAKFRSMISSAPLVEAEKCPEAQHFITPLGAFLRKTSLDELPQLWSVLIGDMSLIGPRPVLPIVKKVIKLRHEAGVDKLKPGISGWAQINGRTTITDEEKVSLDIEYMNRRSTWFDIKIIFLTIIKVLRRDNIVR